MTALTPARRAALAFIQEHIDRTGQAPTRLEIRRGLGVRSGAHVERVIEALCDSGHIAMIPFEPRNIRLLRRVQVAA